MKPSGSDVQFSVTYPATFGCIFATADPIGYIWVYFATEDPIGYIWVYFCYSRPIGYIWAYFIVSTDWRFLGQVFCFDVVQ
jgi:hypothetical protein